MNLPAGKTVPKMNNQSLKNACFQSPVYFQKSKAYFLKSKAYFFESKPSFFPALFIPKMNSAIIPARFRRNRSSVFWGLSAMPLPSNPSHPAGRPVSLKNGHTYNVRVRVRAWWTTLWSPVNHAPSPVTSRPTMPYHPRWRSAPFPAKITCRVGKRPLPFFQWHPLFGDPAPLLYAPSPSSLHKKAPFPKKNSLFSLFRPPSK